MELLFTEGPINWDVTRGNIATGMYTMREFDEDDMDMEDGKPPTNNSPNNTNTNNTPSIKMRDLSQFQGTKTLFCGGYDSDGNNRPFVPALIIFEIVEEDNNIVPSLESSLVAETVIFLNMATDTTKTTPLNNDYPVGVLYNIEVVDFIKMNNITLKKELYLHKEQQPGNKAALSNN